MGSGPGPELQQEGGKGSWGGLLVLSSSPAASSNRVQRRSSSTWSLTHEWDEWRWILLRCGAPGSPPCLSCLSLPFPSPCFSGANYSARFLRAPGEDAQTCPSRIHLPDQEIARLLFDEGACDQDGSGGLPQGVLINGLVLDPLWEGP